MNLQKIFYMINLLFFPGKKSWGFINLKNLVSFAMNTAVAPDAYGYVILPETMNSNC